MRITDRLHSIAICAARERGAGPASSAASAVRLLARRAGGRARACWRRRRHHRPDVRLLAGGGQYDLTAAFGERRALRWRQLIVAVRTTHTLGEER